ncbi:3-isopropylmalate dehydratase small subunit [Corynebacterium sp. Q4381]|uniref:3-isopropylmalate dehydratase small subunit n=1 Tax=Corynebacterium sp. Marseille-Q4381 TaxID=3121597 RepID=UPI002FE59212
MEKFTTHTGVGVPLTRTNVDTDQIIPARYLKRVSRTGFEDGLFSNWRENEADFVLNQDAYRNGSVLFAGEDFGTGSSREHAVWALMDYGFRAVFSPRFADIFRGNSGKAGFLAGIMTESDIELIWKQLEQQPGLEATVSLEDQTVTVGENTYTFEIDEYTRWRLMEGLDDIGLTLRDEAAIESFEASRPSFKPAVDL